MSASILVLVAGLASPAFAQAPNRPTTPTLGDEARDHGVAPTDALRLADHSSATPLVILGASRVSTDELLNARNRPPLERPILFDVLGLEHDSLPGAIWLPGAGRGSSFEDVVQSQLAAVLAAATGGDRARWIVFFCSDPRCWLSYNAALRAVRLGYTRVGWYRGGIAAWLEAGGEVERPRVQWKPPPG